MNTSIIAVPVVLLGLFATRCDAQETLRLITIGIGPNSGAEASYAPTLSQDGRFVVFVSVAKNLVTNDNLAPYLDVFVRDRMASRTALVSVNISAVGGGNADANFPSISAEGKFVAFASAASNLINDDTNNATDIFLRDLANGVTRLVSVGSDGVSNAQGGNPLANEPQSGAPLISADSRWVVFESSATNLVANDTNGIRDIFARDMRAGTTVVISVGAQRPSSPSDAIIGSHSASITLDAQRVAFVSTATGLVPAATNELGEIYVRDLSEENTYWASTNVGIYFAPRATRFRCFFPTISANGRSVVFKAASDSGPALVFHHDLKSGSTTLLASNASTVTCPTISSNGQFVAYEEGTNIFVWDAQLSVTQLVNVRYDGLAAANGVSRSPTITAGGSSVLFLSSASDLLSRSDTQGNATFQLYVRDLRVGTTRLVSGSFPDEGPGAEQSVSAISGDGKMVVFDSENSNLIGQVLGDLNQASDIFLWRLSTRTELISRKAGRTLTTIGSSSVGPSSVSADGRFVVFSSLDGDLLFLTAKDTNRVPDVFVGDLLSCCVQPVSIDRAGTLHTGSFVPRISANGRYVTFVQRSETDGTNTTFRWDMESGTASVVNSVRDSSSPISERTLPPAPISADGRLVTFASEQQIFVRDFATSSSRLVSVAASGVGGGSDTSRNPLLSPDARWVVFQSRATNLVTNTVPQSFEQIYARDLIGETTRLLSFDQSGQGLMANAEDAVFSASSRLVAFSAGNVVYLHDLVAGTNRTVETNAANPSLNGDGRLIAYEIRDLVVGRRDVVLRRLDTGETNLISLNSAGSGGGNGDSVGPQITHDGRFIVFASKASDLVVNDQNSSSDIFVRDVTAGATLLVSVNRYGTGSGNGPSTGPVLGADGRTVVFQSFASDLVWGDYNEHRDVFALRLGSGDSDGDELEDDWEFTYFGTLARDGSGDFDGDGISDRGEYDAGTNPASGSSVLRVLSVTSPGTGAKTLLWSAVPGKSYRVEFKNNVEDADWSELAATVISAGSTASWVDGGAASEPKRFYRVVALP